MDSFAHHFPVLHHSSKVGGRRITVHAADAAPAETVDTSNKRGVHGYVGTCCHKA